MSAQNSNLTNLGEVQSVAEGRKERIETSKMLEAVEKNYQPKGGGINNILLKTASHPRHGCAALLSCLH